MFIALTETHLNNSINDAEIQLSNYSIFHQDRSSRSHGGTAVYVHNDLCTTVVAKNSNQYYESIIVKIAELNLVLGVIYCPPGCPIDKFKENLDIINDNFQDYSNDPKKNWILALMGDFNFPFVHDWNSPSRFTNSIDNEKVQSVLLSNLVEDFNLLQTVDFPTRKENLLDSIFISNPKMILNNE